MTAAFPRALNSNLILLIRLSLCFKQFCLRTLNSNLILLILLVLLLLKLVNCFKFQSDSINTQLHIYQDGVYQALNSNLILLIRLFPVRAAVDFLDTLNSNLILLIPMTRETTTACASTLNSNLILLILRRTINLGFSKYFKFQSDSINTTVSHTPIAVHFIL